MDIQTAAKNAKAASIHLSATLRSVKDKALKAIADTLSKRKDSLFQANEKDIARSLKDNLPAPLLKRLSFDEEKLKEVIGGIDSLIDLPDPVGETMCSRELSEGLELYQVRCPIGVMGVIFESRPDALVQISTLCLKSGNAVLLKGGSEALYTNRALADAIRDASEFAGVPKGWIQLLETRADVDEMLRMDDCIDLLIPRGSNEFVKYIMEHSNIPVLGHADGICHVYVDADADLDMAVDIVVDAKCQYVAVCNAMETLLVNSSIAEKFLPMVKGACDAQEVELRACARTLEIIEAVPATDLDWRTEYLAPILSVKIVDNLDEAIDHINSFGSGHTDAIVTEDASKADRFMNLVDSGNVFWNCSTRFSDGYRFGLGAEVGISTNKIHARGPVGLEGLLIYKWKLKGKGHRVSDYSKGNKSFTHRVLQRSFSV